MTITHEDVAVALGRPITDAAEVAQVEWWVSSALLQIQARLGDPAALDQDVVKFVVVEAVAAKTQNPDGAVEERVDDYSYRLPAESRRVTILDDWWRMLDPDTGSGAFSARPYFEPDSLDAPPSWA